MKAREFHQIAGRAGRAGYDTAGYVVVQAPEHTIENARNLAKAGDDPKKLRKVQRKKAPDGFVTWTEDSFERLVAAPPEPLVSRMRVTHAMVLNVMARQGDPFAAMRKLLRDNHEDPRRQVRHVRQAVQIYRSLLAAGVVERLETPDAEGRLSRLVEDLQLGFALNQPLSAFALGAVEVLDPDAPAYPLDVVSVVEATLEDPRQVLLAQQFKARGEAVAEMKADGIEYEERMELLDEVTWPKPLAELLTALLATYRPDSSVGPRGRAVAEVDRPGDVGAGDDLLGVRRLAGTGAVRGTSAALPLRRVPGPAADRPRLRPDRGCGRHRRVAGRGRPPDRLQPRGRVGGTGLRRPGHPRADARQRPRYP